MSTTNSKGALYHCPVCGAEIVILAPCMGCFTPSCCNEPMEYLPRLVVFYFCEVCGAEIAVLNEGNGPFQPQCCGKTMQTDNTH